jgi:hypothetical protein
VNPSEECRWAGLGGTGQMPAARCVLDISGGMSLRIGDLGRTNRIQLELDAVAAARNSSTLGTALPLFHLHIVPLCA